MNQRDKFVQMAISQKGTKGGSKYVAWYNKAMGSKLPLGCAWCAIFVSWCARQIGITTSQLPNFAGCTSGRNVFKRMGIWRERDKYTPLPGDLVLFDWDGDPTLSEHVGLVTRCDDAYTYTIEGNTKGTVREKKYPRKSAYILGYAAWVEQEQEKEQEKEEEVDMTNEEVKKLVAAEVKKALAEQDADIQKMVEKELAQRDAVMAEQAQKVSPWAKEAWERASGQGVFDGTRPGGNLTREQGAVVLGRLGLLGGE